MHSFPKTLTPFFLPSSPLPHTPSLQCSDLLLSKGGEERVKKALASRGESALWSSLGAMKPHELAMYVSVQAKSFSDELAMYKS